MMMWFGVRSFVPISLPIYGRAECFALLVPAALTRLCLGGLYWNICAVIGVEETESDGLRVSFVCFDEVLVVTP